MGSMTSVSSILESVGIDYQALTAQVRDSHRAAEAGGHNSSALDHERLACALEQLAARLSAVGDNAERHLGDYYLDDMASEIIDLVTAKDDKDPVETLRTHLDLDGSQPLLPATAVFGYPELRCVTHLAPDYTSGKFTLSSYLVDVRTGDVTPVPGGPQTVAEAAAALRA